MSKLELSLHSGQKKIFQARDHKTRVVCSGRRFGKTRLSIYEAIYDVFTFPGQIDKVSPETILFALPTFQQASKIVWEPLVAMAESELAPYVAKIDRVRHTIWFKGGKPPIRVVGANDRHGDSLRGSRIYRFKGDEVQDFKPGVLDAVVFPAMADTEGSTALLTFTPKGKLNHTYNLAQRCESDPERYRLFHMPTYTNPLISREEIEGYRKTLPPKLFQQEFEASWESFPGKVYYELGEENRCDTAPSDFKFTILACDWGDTHPAIVVNGLGHDNRWYFLEGWEPNLGVPIPLDTVIANAKRLSQKWDCAMSFADPSRPSNILEFRKIGKADGIKGLEYCKEAFNRIEEGIDQVHSLIYQRRLMFPRNNPSYDDRADGLVLPTPQGYISPSDAYQQHEAYHREVDPLTQEAKPGTIAPGQRDHVCDCERYLVAVKTGQPTG